MSSTTEPLISRPAGSAGRRSARTGALLLAGAALLLVACGPAVKRAFEEDTISRLKRDIAKVRFAIRTTKTLLARARGAKYLPDLYNRLAGLYVEQARYHYMMAYEKQKNRSAGVVSVQARLLKNQAIATYRRLLALFPEYPDADKVLFYTGHEQRELGEYDSMLKTYQELADKHPKSEFRLEGLLVMGDYHFDKAELNEAEKYYNMVLESAETRVHAMARYKLAWCKVNRGDFKEALKLFEGSIAAARRWFKKDFTKGESSTGGGKGKIDLRREALVDSVFCYTDVHKPDGALEYFAKRADSKTTYLAALDKLGNRYYVKQDWKATAMVYREILSMTGDVEDSLEYAHRLFESVTNGKLYDHGADDVRALVSVIRRRYYNHAVSADQQKKLVDTFEKYTRDIATRLQDLANNKKEREFFVAAAEAYKAYLTFFDRHKNAPLVESNLAEALFAAKEFLEAGEHYEKAAHALKSKESRDALHTAVVAYFDALKEGNKLGRLEVVQGRAGLRRAGREFIRRYPRDGAIREVKFNLARTYYDAGEFHDTIRLFTALVNEFPTSKEAPIAAHLVLDAYHSQEDFDGLIAAGKAFTQMANLGGPEFKNEVAEIVKSAEDSLLRTETIKASDEGEGGDKLDDIARKYRGTSLGEKALLNKFVTARSAKDPEKLFEVGEEFLRAYPGSKQLGDVLATMGQIAAGSLQFERAATYLEAAARRKGDQDALDLYKAAARFRVGLGQRAKAERALNTLLRTNLATAEKADLAMRVSRLHIQANDWGAVIGLLKRATAAGAVSAQGLYLLGYAQFRQGLLADAQSYLEQAVSAGKGSSGDDREAAAAAQYYLAEVSFKTFESIQLTSDLSQLGPTLQQKLTYMAQTRAAYKTVVGLGSGVWSVAALGRLAAVDQQAADAMRNLALPAGLPDDVVKQVRGALESNAAPLAQEATAALKECGATARKLKVLSESAKACAAGQTPQADPQSSIPVPRVSWERPRGAVKLQQTLAQRPNDLNAIVELGTKYLEGGNPYMARLILGKGLEVRESAEILNLLGVATARLGEYQDALDLFEKALKKNADLGLARLNKASLLARFGYRAEAAKERARVRNKERLTGDPGLLSGG